ncbi:MAG: chemotaxis protein CheB [Methanoculleus sp.]
MDPTDHTAHGVAGKEDGPLAIVGIGASAGGLEALEEFFGNMPPGTGIAFVLIIHADSATRGLLPEILQRFTDMPVREARDGMKVEANVVYVKPAETDLSIFHGVIGHLRPTPTYGPRMPIDSFFQHLAEDQNGRAVGIVLSGAGSDGTLGVRTIKEHAGMVMAQDPGSARFAGMPANAIASRFVDHIAPPGELPELLIQYVGFSAMVFEGEALDRVPEEADLRRIFTLIYLRTGQDFSRYKRSTIRRRIERRMAIHQIPGIREYVQFLRTNPPEVEILADEFLIGVTRFFRDPEAWLALREAILREMIPSKPEGNTIRVWCVGCSTGEEAYSLAIVLRECLDILERPDEIQVFATDIDARAIDIARRATYPVNIAADVSPERLERFFIKENVTYRICKEIRDSVVFAIQNVISDPPFTRLDILSCRNLLIYLSLDLQKQLIPLFQYALNPGGLLFLGTAESISGFEAQLKTIGGTWKIFQRREGAPMQIPQLELSTRFTPQMAAGQWQQEFVRGEEGVAALAQEWLLAQYVPPAMIVNRGGDILYSHGRIGRYLEPHPGGATLNIHTAMRREIRDALAPVLRVAAQGGEGFVQKDISVQMEDSYQQVLFTVRPIGRWTERDGMLFVITFQDGEEQGRELLVKEEVIHTSSDGVSAGDLRQEVARARLHLRHTIEDMQASQEELQSANEELSNTNEELTTSKEELQSLNEELVTVNAEHQRKIEDLSQINDDLQNLLQSTEIAILFLDNDLRIRRFTDPIRAIVNLQTGDVGRPIIDLAIHLRDGHLPSELRAVLRTLQVRVREVQATDGRWLEMRIRPYRTMESRIDGLMVIFVDISPIKELDAAMQEAHAYAEAVVATAHEPLAVLDADLRVISANHSFSAILGTTPGAVEEKLMHISGLRRLFERILSEKLEFEDFEIDHDLPEIGSRTMRISARRVRAGPKDDRILLTIEDVID